MGLTYLLTPPARWTKRRRASKETRLDRQDRCGPTKHPSLPQSRPDIPLSYEPNPTLACWMEGRDIGLTVRGEHTCVAEGMSEGSTRDGYKASGLLEGLERVLLGVGLAVSLVLAATPAPSLAAEPACPNEPVRAQSDVNPATGHPYSTELPDCRSYEQVTSEKNDADVMLSPLITNYHSAFGGFGLVASDNILWEAPAAWPYGEPSNGDVDVRNAVRGLEGWSQTTLAPASVNGEAGFKLRGASDDLSNVLLSSTDHSTKIERLLLREPGGTFSSAVAIMGEGEHGSRTSVSFAQLSGDASHVFFVTNARLVPGDTHGPTNSYTDLPDTSQVYEWTRSEGLQLAGVDTEGMSTSECGANIARGGILSAQSISENGSRMVFQSPDPRLEGVAPAECRHGPNGEYVSDLYERESYIDSRGETADRTMDISKPLVGQVDYGAAFVGMSRSGSKVFLVSESALTPDKAYSGPGYADLYEYDVETKTLRRLSVGTEEADVYAFTESLSSAAIVSADGTHIYFTALGRLVPGVGRTRAESEAAHTENMYVYAHGRITFIASVTTATQSESSGEGGAQGPPLALSHAAVTSDGSDLVFDSDSRLASYENEGHAELYRYDQSSGTISCISCSSAGLPPNDEHGPVLRTSFQQEPQGTLEQFGGLSEDGSTVFFASTNRLLPAAVNAAEPEEDNPLYDIYEWHEGVLSLISTGTSTSSDFLLGASPTGSDVYFLTASQLVPQDGDHAADIYDVRIGGGFAPPSVTPPCESIMTCRSMPANPPTTVTPVTIAVKSEGNATVVESMPSKGKTVKAKSRRRKLTCRQRALGSKNAKKRKRALQKCARGTGKAKQRNR